MALCVVGGRNREVERISAHLYLEQPRLFSPEVRQCILETGNLLLYVVDDAFDERCRIRVGLADFGTEVVQAAILRLRLVA